MAYDPAIAAAAQIGVDQRIRVADASGKRVDIRVTAIGVNYIEGRTISDETIRMELDQIKEVEGREKAPGKTGALVGGLVFMLGAMAVASGAYWVGP